jgi:hypothetical protein
VATLVVPPAKMPVESNHVLFPPPLAFFSDQPAGGVVPAVPIELKFSKKVPCGIGATETLMLFDIV